MCCKLAVFMSYMYQNFSVCSEFDQHIWNLNSANRKVRMSLSTTEVVPVVTSQSSEVRCSNVMSARYVVAGVKDRAEQTCSFI